MGNMIEQKDNIKIPLLRFNILVERDRKYTSDQVKEIVSESDKGIKEK